MPISRCKRLIVRHFQIVCRQPLDECISIELFAYRIGYRYHDFLAKLWSTPVKSLITFQNQAPSQLGIDPAFEEAELWQGSQPWNSALEFSLGNQPGKLVSQTSFGSSRRIVRCIGIESAQAARQDNPSNNQRERVRRHADDATP
jgi:hypothetical protein